MVTPGRLLRGAPDHPDEYLSSDLSRVDVIDCGLVGKVARQGELAVTISPVAEGLSVTGEPGADGGVFRDAHRQADSRGDITLACVFHATTGTRGSGT